jgi:hypothetical protein
MLRLQHQTHRPISLIIRFRRPGSVAVAVVVVVVVAAAAVYW